MSSTCRGRLSRGSKTTSSSFWREMNSFQAYSHSRPRIKPGRGARSARPPPVSSQPRRRQRHWSVGNMWQQNLGVFPVHFAEQGDEWCHSSRTRVKNVLPCAGSFHDPAHLRDSQSHGVLPVPLGCSPSIAVTCLILSVYEMKRTATGCGSNQGTLIHQQQRQHRLRTQSVGRSMPGSAVQPPRRHSAIQWPAR